MNNETAPVSWNFIDFCLNFFNFTGRGQRSPRPLSLSLPLYQDFVFKAMQTHLLAQSNFRLAQLNERLRQHIVTYRWDIQTDGQKM